MALLALKQATNPDHSKISTVVTEKKKKKKFHRKEKQNPKKETEKQSSRGHINSK